MSASKEKGILKMRYVNSSNKIAKSKQLRALACAIALIMVFASLPQASFAAVSSGDRATIVLDSKVRDINGNTYESPNISGWTQETYLLRIVGEKDRVCYCIEPGRLLASGGSQLTAKSITTSNFWKELTKRQRQGISLASMYGWRWNVDLSQTEPDLAGKVTNDDIWYATQNIIWEYLHKYRTSPTNRTNNYYYNKLKNRSAGIAYTWILDKMADHTKTWSWSSRITDTQKTSDHPITLKWSNTDSAYMAYDVEDTEKVEYGIKDLTPSGLNVTKNTYEYTFKSTNYSETPLDYTFGKRLDYAEQASFVWGGSQEGQAMYTGSQDLIDWTLATKYDPKGKIKIDKYIRSSEDELEFEKGATFQVWNSKYATYAEAARSPYAEAETVVTDDDGKALTGWLTAGTYNIRQLYGDERHTIMSDKQIVISENDRTYTAADAILNDDFGLKLRVQKKDSDTGKDIKSEGFAFSIYDETGAKVTMKSTAEGDNGRYKDIIVDEFTSGKGGMVQTPEKLPVGKYTIYETKAPPGYVRNTEPLNIEVSRDSENIEDEIYLYYEMQNKPQKSVIKLLKLGETLVTDEVTNEQREGEPVRLPYVSFDIKAAEDIKTADGTVRYKEGDMVHNNLMTKQDGIAQSVELFPGVYEIYETGIYKPIEQPEEGESQLFEKDPDTPYVCDPLTPIGRIEVLYGDQDVEQTITYKEVINHMPVEGEETPPASIEDAGDEEYEGKEGEPEDYGEAKTGDESNIPIIPILVLLFASAGGITYAFRHRNLI